jgi:16S rRNA (uracil1498-N3)-methyltransferase
VTRSTGASPPPVFLAGRDDLKRGSFVLSGAEGRHAATVRRLAVGERADVTDGAGTIAQCVVTSVGPGVIELAVQATYAVPAAEPRVVVVQAIPKGDRGEMAVEIMTEVGVDAVVAWQAERCVAQWRGDRAGKALARWQATAREAAKQSRRAWIPEVTGPEATPAILRRVAAAGQAILLDPGAPAALGSVSLPRRGRRDRGPGRRSEPGRGRQPDPGGSGARPAGAHRAALVLGRSRGGGAADGRVRPLVLTTGQAVRSGCADRLRSAQPRQEGDGVG